MALCTSQKSFFDGKDGFHVSYPAVQRSKFAFWRIISWLLTGGIACESALVASSITEGGSRNIIAVFVATCAALQAALAPEVKASAFRRAWIVLDAALLKEAGLSQTLIDAIQRGEVEIDSTHATALPKAE